MLSAIANAKGSCMVPILLCKLHLEALLVSSINVLITQPFSTGQLTLVNTVCARPGNEYNSSVCLGTCDSTSNNSILTSVCKFLVSLPVIVFCSSCHSVYLQNFKKLN